MSKKYKTYSEQIKHPKWQKKRLEILKRDNFICQICQDTEKTLNVHHFKYKKNKMIWEYDDSELITLCEDCHYIWHELIDKSIWPIEIISRIINLYNEIENKII